ncbi:MAG: FdrA family protein [Actinomycetota bacterium]|nr:FdrA family protein [Actinomycetota bacterium]
MTIQHVELRGGVYRDSVTLMLLTKVLSEDPEIHHPIVAMATPLNVELAQSAGYEVPDGSNNDLLIAFSTDEDLVPRCLELVDKLLNESVGPGEPQHSTDRALTSLGRTIKDFGSQVALISVPGEHAAYQAAEAIEAGAHPVIFSDNVSIECELNLKMLAESFGLIVMGPDCGTVILDGAGLGFANVTETGPIGLISASGTGAQQILALCDQGNVGVRHVLGLGGRDLTDDIGGLSARKALSMLDADPTIEVIGLVAKEIGPATDRDLEEAISSLITPVVRIPTEDLTDGTAQLLRVAGSELPELPVWGSTRERHRRMGHLVGLFSGGTLALESEFIAGAAGCEAQIVDLGADKYTVGRPHPMIDNTLRLERLEEAAEDDSVGAVLIDVVLGHGASANPSAELADVVRRIQAPVFVSLIGTRSDPQDLERQARTLALAGAEVHLSNANATKAAVG